MKGQQQGGEKAVEAALQVKGRRKEVVQIADTEKCSRCIRACGTRVLS